jgi:FAD/FMN-containing dehydrogenase
VLRHTRAVDAAAIERALAEVVPPERVATDPAALAAAARDYHWFSQLLEEELADRLPDVVCSPVDAEELAATLAVAYELRAPVTLRGGGTGNYGQCVPLHGGLVVDVSALDRVLELGDGRARVEAGITFAALDRAAAASAQEITIYPSTYYTATVGGFVAGGSMGVGSLTHGAIADGYVLGATILPCNERPEPEAVTGEAIAPYAHAYGTTGVIADVTVPLVPRLAWEQAVAGFDSLGACHAFCMDVIADDALVRRMITVLEPSIVRLYVERTRLPFRPELTAAMLIFEAGGLDRVARHAARHGGEVEFTLDADAKTRISDYSWNHSTLWAKKADPSLTYLQCGWELDRFAAQVDAVRRAWDGELALHLEYIRWGGETALASLPILRYEGRERLDALVELLEANGVTIANPHTYVIEEGHGASVEPLLEAKRRNDPAGLLNPGKLGGEFLGRQSTLSFTRQA